MVARVVWDHEAAGSSPVTSTRLSLDARRVQSSAFSFTLRLALASVSILQPQPKGRAPGKRVCGLPLTFPRRLPIIGGKAHRREQGSFPQGKERLL